MQSQVAVLTMVRDDAFFLRKWCEYYGGLFGRENLYVINHGRTQLVREIAWGCNVIGIPGDAHKNFDAKRWRLLNGILAGLRQYYTHVICGDVDELVVMDPVSGMDLAQFLTNQDGGRVMTPFGLEVMHLRQQEPDPVDNLILGPRRHVRMAMHYAKPCIVSAPVKLARGGHYSEYPSLDMPDDMYLLHLKYCDFEQYAAALDRRNAMVADIDVKDPKKVLVGSHWFAQLREDDAVFAAIDAMEISPGFDFAPERAQMQRTWRARDDKGMWHFDRHEAERLHVLPDRFDGLL
jgi:Glycosyl transferase family 2